jgi:ATP-binding cassette subfamily F protein uup
MDSPNVLLLDEPTNDFDVETLTALEDLLDSFGGTLLVISHDRYFLERVCDRFVGLLGDSKLRDLPGGIDEYLKLRASTTESSGPATPKAKTSNIVEIKEVRKEIAKYERQIAKLEEQILELESKQSELAFDHEKLAQNMEELAKLTREKSAIEESWLQANTSLEGLEN